MRFKKWLNEATNPIEIQVADFISVIVEQAAQILKQQLGQKQIFSNYVRQIWPKEAQTSFGFVLPNTFPDGIAGKPVYFKVLGNIGDRAQAYHKDGKFDGFVINIKPFMSMTRPEQIDKYVDLLSYAIHHEAEHIYNPGSAPDEDDEDQTRAVLDYMSNPGEIRAHSREMTRAYAKAYPEQPFDLQKAQELLTNSHFNNAHRNYFSNFAQSGKWDMYRQKYPHLGNNPHDQAVQATQEMLPQYNLIQETCDEM